VTKLSDAHRAHLRTSGLSDATIDACGFYTETDGAKLKQMLNWTEERRWHLGAAIVIPFYVPGETAPVLHRVRPDKPRRANEKKRRRATEKKKGEAAKPKFVKYEQPRDVPTVPYFPRPVIDAGWLADASRPLVLTEGEKKAALLGQLGYAVVGSTGVDCFHDKPHRDEANRYRLHALTRAHVALEGRRCVICFDADALENDNVMRAARVLAGMLLEAGAADVLFTHPPKEADAKGIDDYFVHAVAELLDHAQPIDPGDLDAKPRDPRTSVDLGADEHRVIAEVLAELVETRDDLFQRAGRLVHIVADAEKARHVDRPEGAMRLVPVSRAVLRTMIAASVALFTITDDGRKSAHPPPWLVDGILDAGSWAGVRVVTGIAEAPVLRPDGTVLEAPGYDEETGLFLAPTIAVPAIAQRPTREDAARAIAALVAPVRGFPFKSDAHRSVYLSAILSLVARPAIDGAVPLHFIEANVRGAGKSLLCDVVSIVATGHPATRVPPADTEEEWRKRILSILLGGEPLVLIDNVRGTFGSTALDAVLTGTSFGDRLLGKNENATIREVRTLWLATGNNASIGGDLARRMMLCRLESPHENPEDRDDVEGEASLKREVRARRGELLAAALTVLRAWWCAGRPRVASGSVGSFEAWSSVVRNAIVFAGEADPRGTIPEVRERADRDADLTRELYVAWAGAVGENEWTELGRILRDCWPETDEGRAYPARPQWQPLREVLEELTRHRGPGRPSTRALGRRLLAFLGRLSGGLAMESSKNRATNALEWRVARRAEPVSRVTPAPAEPAEPVEFTAPPARPGACAHARARPHAHAHAHETALSSTGSAGSTGDVRDTTDVASAVDAWPPELRSRWAARVHALAGEGLPLEQAAARAHDELAGEAAE
jgi:putative DNA primase/helicase